MNDGSRDVCERCIDTQGRRFVKKTIGTSVSSGTVSRANKRLDDAIEQLRTRELSSCPILILDGRFDKVRENSVIVNGALLYSTS
ncbi:transposase [bacterium]|nr:transposase [candidate division CSSED10-310 bacterium]